ncbi:hypothetical protein ACEZDB_05365 [Streptacidiphilus sp. N1-3]|uniref:Type II secretion system protein GspE N-terminal domain-containing protein n=1 Tax=Streptacidiphilus alkalitolerans TaxID=3342712 RepID=A0ABV6WVK4_9ACTN
MPPSLKSVLASLAIEPSRDECDAVENRLPGAFAGLGAIRRDSVVEVDASELIPSEIGDWLASLPIQRDAVIQVAWIADRLGATMRFATLIDNVDDLWFPAMDDVVALLDSPGALDVLVLDHEERFTLSRVTSLS